MVFDLWLTTKIFTILFSLFRRCIYIYIYISKYKMIYDVKWRNNNNWNVKFSTQNTGKWNPMMIEHLGRFTRASPAREVVSALHDWPYKRQESHFCWGSPLSQSDHIASLLPSPFFRRSSPMESSLLKLTLFSLQSFQSHWISNPPLFFPKSSLVGPLPPRTERPLWCLL